MKVVGHEDVPPDQPGIGFQPNETQQLVDVRVRQPWRVILGTNGEKNDERLPGIKKHSSRRRSSRVEGHGQ
jgi:hypothetical protein